MSKINAGDLLFAWYDEETEKSWVDKKPQHETDCPIGIAGLNGEVARAGVVYLGSMDIKGKITTIYGIEK